MEPPPDLATAKFAPHPEQPVEIDMHTADGVFIKQITVSKVGTVLPQHAHVYDHTTFVAYGAVMVWEDLVYKGVRRAPCALFIKKGVKHTFQTLVDNTTLLCIHNGLHSEVAAVLAENGLEFD